MLSLVKISALQRSTNALYDLTYQSDAFLHPFFIVGYVKIKLLLFYDLILLLFYYQLFFIIHSTIIFFCRCFLNGSNQKAGIGYLIKGVKLCMNPLIYTHIITTH